MPRTNVNVDKDTPSRLDQLIGNEYDVLPFRDLPEPAKLALVQYMAVDGDAWEALFNHQAGTLHYEGGQFITSNAEPLIEALRRALPDYDALYSEKMFGILDVSSERLKAAIMQDEELASSFKDWDEYHASYAAPGDVPLHAPHDRWPAILSNVDDETLQDGWHRTHSYLSQGHATVPLIFFLKSTTIQVASLISRLLIACGSGVRVDGCHALRGHYAPAFRDTRRAASIIMPVALAPLMAHHCRARGRPWAPRLEAP